MKKVVLPLIVLLYVLLSAAFLYFDFIALLPRHADVAKYATIVLSLLTVAFLWKDFLYRNDGVVVLAAMLLTAVTDIFLVFGAREYRYIVIGMAFYGLTMSVYFFRYNYDKVKRAHILPFLLTVPILLHIVFAYEPVIVVTSYYIQVLLLNIISAVRCVKNGRYPRINAALILAAILIFIAGDIVVVLRFMTGKLIYSRLIWVFYTPSQAMLAFSVLDFGKVFGYHRPWAVLKER